MPPWHRCCVCGWWQTSLGACAGCFQTSKSIPKARQQPRTGISNHEPPSQELLHRRWQEAKNSASQPHHVKIERLCQHCLLRTLNSKPDCRGCGRSLQDCARILPGQWPPLGCTAAMLRNFEEPPAATSRLQRPRAKHQTSRNQWNRNSPLQDRPLLNVPLAALKAEISRLEKHLLDMPSEGFQGLHDQTEVSLMAAKREMQARKPEGATLDQAIARQRQTNKAHTVAEAHVRDLKESLQRAEAALQQAVEQENQATQEVQRVRSLISERENGSEIRMPTPTTVPSTVLAGLYQYLQTTGLDYQQMAQVATLLGAAVPPTPPPPVPANGASPLQPNTEAPANLTTAQPRQGRSPAPKRKLPGRTGEADRASTYYSRSPSSRSASRHAGSWRSEPGPRKHQGRMPGLSPPHYLIQERCHPVCREWRHPPDSQASAEAIFPGMFVHKARGITWLHLVQLVAIAGCMDGGQTWGLVSVFLPFRPYVSQMAFVKPLGISGHRSFPTIEKPRVCVTERGREVRAVRLAPCV